MGQNMSYALNFIQAFSTAFLAVLAFYGLQTWKRQITAGRKFGLAEEMLLAIHAASDAINSSRSPIVGISNDLKPRWADDVMSGESPEDAYLVPFKRLTEAHKDKFDNLEALNSRCSILLGDNKLRGCVEQIREIKNEVLAATANLIRDPNHISQEELQNRIFEKLDSGTPDEIRQKLKEIINESERILTPYLRLDDDNF
ncbi:MAG: hypothetical protein O2807_13495 [bacterium]|nr:hypothetical protein [bacterium]